MAAPVFKLPAQFVDQHKAALEAWDWPRRPEMPLAPLDPAFTGNDVLEAIGRGGTTIVRSKGIGTMRRMRAYAESLAPSAAPTQEAIAAVLAARNPAKPD